MQPNYLDRVANNRQNTSQRSTQEQDLRAMVAAIASANKPSIVLTDQTDLGDKISEAITAIATQLSKLDLKGDTDDSQKIVAAIKKLDMSPVIKVAAPVVHSAPVDLTGVERAIEKAMTPVEQEEYSPDRCDLSRYRAQDLYESGDMQYVGFVNPEGNWYIIENDVPKNRMRYVFGTSGYARHFRAAATYEYKLLDKAYNASA